MKFTKLKTYHYIPNGQEYLILNASGSTATPVLNKILYPDGYFTVSSGTGGDFRYFVKDHLGNNRVVNNGSTVYQRTHYYPFGGPYADVGTASDYQPYKYNGKELDLMHGLNTYDYGARQYDPILCRWDRVDPLAEKYYGTSPYAYCGNNPVIRVDGDGRIWDTVWDVANVVYDIGSALVNHISGDHEKAQDNWKDAGYDLIAAIVPVVPAGTTKGIKAVDKIENALKLTASKGNKVALENRLESIAKGIPEKDLGPSGLPKIHNVIKSNLKKAKDAARINKKANTKPVKHSNDKGQKEHFHSTRDGEKLTGRDNINYVNNSSKKNPE